MEQEKIKAIYYIKDLRTDKIIYIGQTINFQKRKRSHFSHKEQPIDKYMYEEGRDNFLMEIFNNVDCANMTEDEILNKEDELILYYDTINNGLNKLRSGLITKEDGYEKYKRAKYCKEHREHVNEYNRKYSKSEKRKEYNKEYKKSEKYKEYCKKYYSTEEYKERKREYMRKNSQTEEYKERKREASRKYRLKKKQQKLANTESL